MNEDIEYEVLSKLPFHEIVKYRESLGISYQTNQSRIERIIRSTRSHIKNMLIERRFAAAREFSPLNGYDINSLVSESKENLVLLYGLRKLTVSNTTNKHWRELQSYSIERYIPILFEETLSLIGLDLDLLGRDPSILKDVKIYINPQHLRQIRIPLEYIHVLLKRHSPEELFIHWGNSIWDIEIGKKIAGMMKEIDIKGPFHRISAAYIMDDTSIIIGPEDFARLASLRDPEFYNKVMKYELDYIGLESIKYRDLTTGESIRYKYNIDTFIDLIAMKAVPLDTLEGYPLETFINMFKVSDFEAASNFMELHGIDNKELNKIMSNIEKADFYSDEFMSFKTYQFLKDKIRGDTLLDLLPKERFYYKIFREDYPDWIYDLRYYPLCAVDILKKSQLKSKNPEILSLIERSIFYGNSLLYNILTDSEKNGLLSSILLSGNLDMIKHHHFGIEMILKFLTRLDCSIIQFFIGLYPELLRKVEENSLGLLQRSIHENNTFNILWLYNRDMLPVFLDNKLFLPDNLSDNNCYKYYLFLKGIKDSKSNA